MERQLVLAVTAVLALACSAAADETIRCARAGSMAIDGNYADWDGIPFGYIEKGPRVTAVANDDRYLYVTFRFSDLDMARTIVSQGAVLWVNPEGEKEAGFGVRYRGTQAVRDALDVATAADTGAPPDIAEGRPAGPSPPRDRPGQPGKAALGAVEVMHFGAADEILGEGVKEDGPSAAAAVVEGAFSYEFRIPLAEISAPSDIAAGEAGRALALGFQIGGLTKAEHDALEERMRDAGGPPGGMGARQGSGGGQGPGDGFGGARGPAGGAGSGGGPPPGGRGGRRTMAVGEIHWVEVILSGPGAGSLPPSGKQ